MREKTNCPNCGAPISGIKCEFCGTQFFDLADLELNKPGFLRVRFNDSMLLFDAIPVEMEIESGCDWDYMPEITIKFITKRARDGTYFKIKKEM